MPADETKRVELDTDLNRIQANREIGRAFRAVQSVRTFYWALASGNGLMILFTLWLLSRVSTAGGAVSPLVYVVLAIYGGLIPLYILGALRLHKEPFVWALVPALVQSVAAALRLASGIDLLALVSTLLALFCWAAFATIVPAMKLMKEYPDLRESRSAFMVAAPAPRAAGRPEP